MESGTSIFQGADININNSDNNEEEEDIEERKRRNEELQNLLMTKLDDFNYDESTVNSSTNVSIISQDEIQNKYRKAVDPNEQLKVLYEVRVREINQLREEYNNYIVEKDNETEALKKKNFIYEAEIQQFKVSLRNSEELLVEKATEINDLRNTLNADKEKYANYDRNIETFKQNIIAYQDTITDLQLKLQASINPLSSNAKWFQSEELQKAHQDKISRLESLLEQQTRTTQSLEKDKISLQEELNGLIKRQNEEEETINTLTKNFESAQQQCQELIDVVEMLTNENRHLRERLDTNYQVALEEPVSDRNSTDSYQITRKPKTWINSILHTEVENASLLPRAKIAEPRRNVPRSAIARGWNEVFTEDVPAPYRQVEKLKKLLVDKSFQIDTLNVKLRNYSNRIQELIEYRQLKSDVYKKDFQQCENREHVKSLLLMQNDLQNYRRTIEDKNQQILSLNSTNKDLLEKVEHMLSRTRDDIQNFSHKYSLPQLEQMAEDLKNAEAKIQELEAKLEKSEERRLSLTHKLQKTEKNLAKELANELETQLKNIKLQSDKDEINYENNIKKLQKDLEVSSIEIANMKQYTDDLIKENTQLKGESKNLKLQIEMLLKDKDSPPNHDTKESIKEKYQEAIHMLHETQKNVKRLEESLQDMTNAKTIAEGEKCTFQFQLKDCESRLENAYQIINDLESEIESLRKDLQEKEEAIHNGHTNNVKLRTELAAKENELRICQENKMHMISLSETSSRKLEEYESEILKLQGELAEDKEKTVKKNLEREIHKAEEQFQENNAKEQALDLLKLELKLREDIQQEYFEKLKEIEEKYQKASAANKDLYKEQAEKMKHLDKKHCEQLASILTECSQKIKELEEERQKLINQLNSLKTQFDKYKQQVYVDVENYEKFIKDTQMQCQEDIQKWRDWSKKFVENCMKIEATNKKTRDKILCNMNPVDAEIAAIEKSYDTKIKKYIKSCKMNY